MSASGKGRMSGRAPRPHLLSDPTPSVADPVLLTDPAAAARAHLLTRKPGWSIRAVYRAGELVASLPPGLAATAEEAITWYRRFRHLPAGAETVRAFPRTPTGTRTA